uniref:Uncharacterized protein n=1 Tax=Arundo donax TaxID=35708 RepID=A0A0A9BWN4_ARUDO
MVASYIGSHFLKRKTMVGSWSQLPSMLRLHMFGYRVPICCSYFLCPHYFTASYRCCTINNIVLTVLREITNDIKLWCMAGAKGLQASCPG